MCAHGIARSSKSTGQRPLQHVKYTKCPVRVNLNEQDDGCWLVTTSVLHHEGHPVTSQDFFSHESFKRLTEDDESFVKDLLRAKTSARNISDVLAQRMGRPYTYQDVKNIFNE